MRANGKIFDERTLFRLSFIILGCAKSNNILNVSDTIDPESDSNPTFISLKINTLYIYFVIL